MSLLLQALQKAAKNRESGSAPPAEDFGSAPAPQQPSTLEPPAAILPPAFALDTKDLEARRDLDAKAHEVAPREPELSIAEEDLFEEDEPLPEESPQRFEPFGSAPSASPADAAAILRANESPSATWIDWLRDRPVWALGIGAGVFIVFYGVYVYLQIAYPGVLRGDFLRQPLTSASPPPPSRPIAVAPKPVPTQRDPLAPKPAETSPAGQAGTPVTAPTTSPATTSSQGISSSKSPAGTPQVGSKPMSSIASTEPHAPATSSTPAVKPLRSTVAPTRTLPQVGAAAPIPADAPNPPAITSDPEQALHPIVIAPKRRSRKEAAMPTTSIPALEQEISSKPIEAASAQVAPAIRAAYQALQAGRLDQAETLYRNALQAEGQNVDALLGLAAIAAQRGQVQQAIGFYDRALEAEPRNPAAQAGLISLIGQADPQMSEARLKQLIAREPSAFLYFSLGNLQASQNQWPAAQQAYFQAFQMQPDNPDYAYNLAIGLEHLNQPKLALTYYRKAIDLSFQKGRANFDQNRVIERIGQLSARVD